MSRRRVLGVVALVLLAANLRTGVASIGPLLPQIRSELGLSTTLAALLVTAPVVCFAVFGAMGPLPARWFGLDRTLCGVLIVAGLGMIVRIGPGTSTLFLGTILVGSAIGMANVLIPGLVKRDYPGRVGLMTGVYTTSMGLGATLAAATSVPIANAIGRGWRGGLAVWLAPVLVALVFWIPRAWRAEHSDAGVRRSPFGPLLRDRVAWQVSGFTAFQSAGFYAMISWLPTIFVEHGFSATRAGLVFAVSSLAGTAAGLVAPALAARRRDQRFALAGATAVTAIGIAGVLVAPTAAPWVWAVLIGLGQGSAFPLALTVMGLRTRNPEQTQQLSAMAQTIAYSFAIIGPLAVGALRDTTGGWTAGLCFLLVLCAAQFCFGLAAGRPKLVLEAAPVG